MKTEVNILKDGKNKVPRICHDPIFKGLFLRESRALIKMIYDITSFMSLCLLKKLLLVMN